MSTGEDLPDEVHLTKFAGARARELTVLTKCISGPLKTKVAFQTLPVHMRRRVMSHNSRRLPRRLRPVLSEVQEEGAVCSRRTRRTPKRLLADFARRQRLYSWLETHIWHAKRFRMTKLWRYNLPEAPCDKAFRACYRAGSAHCLLLDISYLDCVCIFGTIEHLTKGFAHITSSNCGLTTNAKCYINGEREGITYIFDVDKYPYDCLGKVSFIWDIVSDLNATVRFFVHPSFYSNLINVFIKCFELIKVETNPDKSNVVEIASSIYINSKTCVKMVESTKKLNRFRLVGPLSHAILKDVLKPIKIIENESSKVLSQNWFEDLFNNSNTREKHVLQSTFWNKINGLNSPAEIQSKIIIALNVEDPRINFPKKRTKSLPNTTNFVTTSDIINIPKGLNFSLLWNDEVLKNISSKKISNMEINKTRQKEILVPGEPDNFSHKISGVPVILIQYPGSKDSAYKKLGYNCGWDLIVPPGYGMPFWLSLILRGARAGGLRETGQLLFENGLSDFQPDTEASKNENVRQESLLKDRYFKLPPNKRVNFIKLAINSPFICRWKELIENWDSNMRIDNFFVLRDKKCLAELQMMLKKHIISHSFPWNWNCLVPVRLIMKDKGKITNNALICIPLDCDKANLPSSSLIEPLKKDENKNIRKELRIKHKRQLKILRKKSIRRKKSIQNQKPNIISKQNNTILVSKYLTKMQELWLPSNFKNVKNQCSRNTMGYVVKGDFSFSEAKSVGIGYIALKSLFYLLQQKSTSKLVMVRNIFSRQYRYAFIDVIPML